RGPRACTTGSCSSSSSIRPSRTKWHRRSPQRRTEHRPAAGPRRTDHIQRERRACGIVLRAAARVRAEPTAARTGTLDGDARAATVVTGSRRSSPGANMNQGVASAAASAFLLLAAGGASAATGFRFHVPDGWVDLSPGAPADNFDQVPGEAARLARSHKFVALAYDMAGRSGRFAPNLH